MADRVLPHYRMELNNYLQTNGGTGRLSWSKPINEGSDHSPKWKIEVSLDNKIICQGLGGDLNSAKEEAARQVLRHLHASKFAR